MKYVIFMKEDCPYCHDAKALLESKQLKYSTIIFREGQEDILSEVKNTYEWQTVPIILLKDENNIRFIGGYTDLVEYLKHE